MRGGVRLRADEYIKERAKKWIFPWQILKDMDVQARERDPSASGHPEYSSRSAQVTYRSRAFARACSQGRLRFLGEPKSGRLAVVPSLLENSPYLITECLMAGLPLVATDVGGTAELVHPSDATRILAQPNPKSLAALLRPILQEVRAEQRTGRGHRVYPTAAVSCSRPTPRRELKNSSLLRCTAGARARTGGCCDGSGEDLGRLAPHAGARLAHRPPAAACPLSVRVRLCRPSECPSFSHGPRPFFLQLNEIKAEPSKSLQQSSIVTGTPLARPPASSPAATPVGGDAHQHHQLLTA